MEIVRFGDILIGEKLYAWGNNSTYITRVDIMWWNNCDVGIKSRFMYGPSVTFVLHDGVDEDIPYVVWDPRREIGESGWQRG